MRNRHGSVHLFALSAGPRPEASTYQMIRIFSIVIPTRVFTLFIFKKLFFSRLVFVAAAWTDPDLGDVSIFLLYDSGILRIAILVGFIVLCLFFRNLYAEVRIRSRLALFQDLCMIFGLAFIGQGAIGYLNPSWIIPRKMMLHWEHTGRCGYLWMAASFRHSGAKRTVAAGRVYLFLGTSPTVARIAGHFAAHPEVGIDQAWGISKMELRLRPCRPADLGPWRIWTACWMKPFPIRL